MLHGYVVVVKRTGVDGSKFPVTERTIKIGVTAGCHILINTPYVADEHCALTVKDNGQVWVKNLSKDHATALNEQNIDSEALLNHGDILEIGGRLVRWEYLPESKYYHGSIASKTKGSPFSKGSQTPKSTPKSSKKLTMAKTPRTPSSTSKRMTPKKQLINKIIELKINTPKSAKKASTGQNVSTPSPSRKSPATPKVSKTPHIKSPKSTAKGSPKVKKTPLKISTKVQKTSASKTPKLAKGQKTPASKTPKSAKVQKTSASKTPKSIKVQKTPASKASKSVKSSSPKANSLIKSQGRTSIKVKTPKTIRKSLFTSPKPSPKRMTGKTPSKIDSPNIGKVSEKKTKNAVADIIKGRSSFSNPSGSNKLTGRKSLQATKRLFSAADVARRKSEAISQLNDEELLVLANLNYRKKLSEEKNSSIKRQSTPLKRLSNSDKRISRHRSSMKAPAMSTILEPVTSIQTFTPKPNSPLKTPSPTSSAKARANKDVHTKQLNTPVNKRVSAAPMIIFSSEKKSPIKRMEPKSPTKISAKELLKLMALSNQTPPEVVTPDRSPSKSKRNEKHSPLTPLYRVMTIGVVDETPPEVVTPRSSMSSTKSSSSVARLRNSLPNSPLVTQSPVTSPKSSVSPLKSGLLSPISPRKSALKSSNSPRSSPRGNKENLNRSASSPKVSFNLQTSKDETHSPIIFSPKALETIRTSARILSESPAKLQSPGSRKSSPIKNIPVVTPNRNSPVKATQNKDATQLSKSVSAIEEVQLQSPPKRSSLRNSSPGNISFKSARSTMGTPIAKTKKSEKSSKVTAVIKKKPGTQIRRKVKLNSQPDKTKKKALLVLGKASQKKTEILVKQKLLKRAIKLTNKQPRKAINVKSMDVPNIQITAPSSPDKTTEKGKSVSPEKIVSPKTASVSLRLSGNTDSFGSVLKELSFPNIASHNYRRRSSKRISAMNEVERPDFTELSPSALGLTPRFVQPIITPKEKKRRSTSLTTPRTKRSPDALKAVSTSKKLSKTKENVSANSSFDFQTPDISQEMFVSPLTTPGVKSKATPASLRKGVLSMITPQRVPTPVKPLAVTLKQLSPSAYKNKTSPVASPGKSNKISKISKSPKNDLTEVEGIKRIFSKSPRNDLRQVGGVKKLLKTPQQKKVVVKRAASKKQIKSPRNDLSNPVGVKKLFAVRKVQNSPKNDLSNVAGVKTLFNPQKSPKNRLSDFRGVKKIVGTPKVQKEPENSYVDVKGVKELLGSPKVQKSPRNRLSDFRGVKNLLASPKVQKEPENSYVDLKGVKELLGSPKVQNSPRNRLSDLRGVKTLLGSQKVQKSPKNRLSDFKGVKRLLRSPLTQKSPTNDLTDVQGIRKLFASPKATRSPKNDLRRVTGVKELFEVESPIPAQRKVKGVNTPVPRPTRSKLSVEATNVENEGESAKLRVRQKTLSSPKSDSPLKVFAQETETASTPVRRGRPKRTATVALETENIVPPKTRRGATSKVRNSESSSSDNVEKQGSKERLPRSVKPQGTTKPTSPVRKTRARGKTQPDPTSSPSSAKKTRGRGRPQPDAVLSPSPAKKTRARGKAQPEPASSPSPAKKIVAKTLRSRTQTTDSVSSPITKALRTRAKAQPSSPVSSPKRKTKVAKTSAETRATRTRSARTQSANPEKSESSKKAETSNRRGKRT